MNTLPLDDDAALVAEWSNRIAATRNASAVRKVFAEAYHLIGSGQCDGLAVQALRSVGFTPERVDRDLDALPKDKATPEQFAVLARLILGHPRD